MIVRLFFSLLSTLTAILMTSLAYGNESGLRVGSLSAKDLRDLAHIQGISVLAIPWSPTAQDQSHRDGALAVELNEVETCTREFVKTFPSQNVEVCPTLERSRWGHFQVKQLNQSMKLVIATEAFNRRYKVYDRFTSQCLKPDELKAQSATPMELQTYQVRNNDSRLRRAKITFRLIALLRSACSTF